MATLEAVRSPEELLAEIDARQDFARTTGGILVRQFVAEGYGRVKLFDDEAEALQTLRREADDFFANGPEYNARYSNTTRTNGYRPHESAFNNGDPKEGDANDSFLYWNPEVSEQIEHEGIQSFLNAFENYRRGPAVRIMGSLMRGLADFYGYDRELPFEDASVMQINSFNEPSDRELLQTPHEDGVLATIIWTSAPGLEGVRPDGIVPLTTAQDEVFIMPGGILTTMTGGEIQPLIHQARNHDEIGRKTVMYFSCPDIHRGPIPPYRNTEANAGVNDVRKAIIDAVRMFGLHPDYLLTPLKEGDRRAVKEQLKRR